MTNKKDIKEKETSRFLLGVAGKSLMVKVSHRLDKWTYWIDIGIAVAFGAASALVVYGFAKIIEFSDRLQPLGLHPVFIVALPGFGGLIVGTVAYVAKIRPSGGVTDVIESLSVKRRVLGDPKAILKPVLAALAIITGNPVGSDIMIGSQVSAQLAYLIRLPRERRRLHIACGASAGLSASLMSPLSAIAFAFEVILLEYTAFEFGMLAISSATAFSIAKLLGLQSPVKMPTMSQISIHDFLWFALLGVACFAVGYAWANLTRLVERLTKKIPFAPIVGPTIAGFSFGLIALLAPGVWGPGYRVISELFANNFTIIAIIGLLLGKMIGNSLVLGSGGAGGDLAPIVFLGASVGAVFSNFMQKIKPELILAGICAQMSATMHAPLTGILMAIELSGQLTESIPVMVAASIAALVSIKVMPWSIYETRAKDRGLVRDKRQFQRQQDASISDFMTRNFLWVDSNDSVKKGIDLMRENHLQGIPVLKKGMLHGVLTLKDLREKVGTLDLTKKVELFCTEGVEVVMPDTNVGHAWKLMRESEIGWLMVTSKTHPGKLLGIVTKDDMLHAFARRSSRIHD